jgi:hypothetical protein
MYLLKCIELMIQDGGERIDISCLSCIEFIASFEIWNLFVIYPIDASPFWKLTNSMVGDNLDEQIASDICSLLMENCLNKSAIPVNHIRSHSITSEQYQENKYFSFKACSNSVCMLLTELKWLNLLFMRLSDLNILGFVHMSWSIYIGECMYKSLNVCNVCISRFFQVIWMILLRNQYESSSLYLTSFLLSGISPICNVLQEHGFNSPMFSILFFSRSSRVHHTISRIA